tara:strand:- start:359 stop:913 length:555 start_codon:yes stop_codon:yes gene_type:complete
MTVADPTPEFSVGITLDSLGEDVREIDLEADRQQRAALAARFGLVSLDSFRAHLTLVWLKTGKVLSVTGRISADVTQNCVVTLDPFPATVAEEVDIVFARNSADTADIVDPDDVEPLEGETLDLGEIVAEELSLALDPYPRHPNIDPAALELGPGASLMTEEEAEKGPKRANPFEILAELKPKK